MAAASMSTTGATASAAADVPSTPDPPLDNALVATATASECVFNGDEDIAKSEYLEQLRVGVAGRPKNLQIYIKGTKMSTAQYDPIAHGPVPGRTLSILPTKEELEGRSDTRKFVVVGVVLAAEPYKYSDLKNKVKGGKDPAGAARRIARGVLPAESNLLRVVIPTTEYILSTAIKYYVACNPVYGLCVARTIQHDAIFYFDEVWQHVDPKVTDVVQRRAQLTQACKMLAARIRTPQPRALTTINPKKDGPKKSQDLTVSAEENALNVLNVNYSLWNITQQRSEMETLVQSVERMMPDLEKKPSNQGTDAFFQFEDALNDEEAGWFIAEMKRSYPSLPLLDPSLIIKAHNLLRSEKKDDDCLGYALPYGSVALFLHLLHDRAVSGWDERLLKEIVADIIHNIEITNLYHSPTAHWTHSKGDDDDGDKNKWIALVSVLRDKWVHVREFHSKVAQELREQHGGVNSRSTIDEIMIKIGTCVDMSALMALAEEMFAIHAEQVGASHRVAAEFAAKAVALIDTALVGEQGLGEE